MKPRLHSGAATAKQKLSHLQEDMHFAEPPYPAPLRDSFIRRRFESVCDRDNTQRLKKDSNLRLRLSFFMVRRDRLRKTPGARPRSCLNPAGAEAAESASIERSGWVCVGRPGGFPSPGCFFRTACRALVCCVQALGVASRECWLPNEPCSKGKRVQQHDIFWGRRRGGCCTDKIAPRERIMSGGRLGPSKSLSYVEASLAPRTV